jgi:hypothetical protein
VVVVVVVVVVVMVVVVVAIFQKTAFFKSKAILVAGCGRP